MAMRRTVTRLLLNVSSESPSFRAKPGMANPLFEASISPYKDQFIEYWSTPVPFADREYGEKPKLGDPVPTRRAATSIIVAKNKYADLERVAAGMDNDYKVLMMYREAKGNFRRDQFVFPAFPVSREDYTEDWEPILYRRGVTTRWADLHHRLTAHRALLAMANILVIPKEGGGIAEVEGPPGPNPWHLMVYTYPKAMKQLVEVLELPMEGALAQFTPFRHVCTPTSETFRYDNRAFLIPFDKIPDVKYTIATVGERLIWVSPLEAMARFNAGVMNMPTSNVILMSELHNDCPTFAEVQRKTNKDVAPVVQPELFHHGQTKVATVLLPGDMHHSDTTAEDRAAKYVRRFAYEKDYPYGIRAVFDERPATPEEQVAVWVPQAPALLEEITDVDQVYARVPYPKRKRATLEQQEALHTPYQVPEMQLRDGKEDEQGLIPSRHNYMAQNPKNMYEEVK